MDVVLGVAVTGRVARLAMIGSPGTQVFDQYAFDLPDDALSELAETIIGTYREVTDSGNRLAATRLCLPDPAQAETLRQTVVQAGVQNVDVVTEAEAAVALARSQGADASLLLAADDTVSLTVVDRDSELTSVLASVPIGAAGAAVACAAVLQQAPTQVKVMLTGQRLDLDSIAAELRSTTPVEVPVDAGYAIARGAAQSAEAAGVVPAAAATQLAPIVADTQAAPVLEATQAAPVVAATQATPVNSADTELAPQLAYSQASDDEPWPGYNEISDEALAEFVPEQEDDADYTTAIPAPPPRLILMGSAVGFLVASLATLAVTVAVNIRPAAVVSAQPPPAQSDTVPGRYLPPVPHEPDPVALPVAVLTPPAAAPAAPAVRSRSVSPPALAPAPQVPAPVEAPPPPPAPVGVPAIPIPLPPIVVFPPLNPWTPPTTVTTTVTSTPTTTTTPTTTSTTPTTTTTTSPTTSTTATSTSTATSSAPPTSSPEVPIEPVTPVTPVTPAEPAYTAPTRAPEPASTPAPEPAPAVTVEAPPVTKAPSSGGESSSGGSSRSGGSGGSGHSGEAPVTTIPGSP
ncbi:hypothetical protein ACXPWS_25700 [Mycobacterium sp. BMJ-28]